MNDLLKIYCVHRSIATDTEKGQPQDRGNFVFTAAQWKRLFEGLERHSPQKVRADVGSISIGSDSNEIWRYVRAREEKYHWLEICAHERVPYELFIVKRLRRVYGILRFIGNAKREFSSSAADQGKKPIGIGWGGLSVIFFNREKTVLAEQRVHSTMAENTDTESEQAPIFCSLHQWREALKPILSNHQFKYSVVHRRRQFLFIYNLIKNLLYAMV